MNIKKDIETIKKLGKNLNTLSEIEKKQMQDFRKYLDYHISTEIELSYIEKKHSMFYKIITTNIKDFKYTMSLIRILKLTYMHNHENNIHIITFEMPIKK